MRTKKIDDLRTCLRQLRSCAVAFSSGLDSTFLLAVAQAVLGDEVMGVTVVTEYVPRYEIDEVNALVKKLGVRHSFLSVPFLEDIRFNPENRCYLCKKKIFSHIIDVAKKENLQVVLDGSNADDLGDYRPGHKALEELCIRSPLLELGFSKADIRSYSKQMQLPTWDKPPYACLLSRIPYGEEITIQKLEMIQKAEHVIMQKGIRSVRVRYHGNMARIEVAPEERKTFFSEQLLDEIDLAIKQLGFTFVSFDLAGYKIGNMNYNIDTNAKQ